MKKMIDDVLIPQNATIAVALSGGKDSMCLLHLLKSCQEKFNIKVKAVNVEHGIRGQDSVNDSAFVKEYCQNNGIELMQTSVNAVEYAQKNKISVENSARILRYDFFDQIIKDGFADYIATAHHLNDNFETILLNLFRGSGVAGLTGIPKKRDYILRPLLNVDRSQIDGYVLENGVLYVEDKTNFDDEYTRNYLRLNVIPKIIEKFPTAHFSAQKTAEILKEEDDYLNCIAREKVEEKNGKYYISINLAPAIFKRAVKIALYKTGVEKDYEKVHFDDVVKLSNLQTGSKICLPKGVVAIKEYDSVCIYKQEEIKAVKTLTFGVGEFDFLDKVLKITSENLPNSLTFDKDKIPSDAIIRTRREGDVFTKFGGKTKKLKEYFIDKKIPLLDRDGIPLVAVDNDVLLIFGVEISEKIKVDEKTENRLFASVTKK